MKHKLSISIDKETVHALLKKIRQSNGDLRSKSHAVEVAVRKFIEEK